MTLDKITKGFTKTLNQLDSFIASKVREKGYIEDSIDDLTSKKAEVSYEQLKAERIRKKLGELME